MICHQCIRKYDYFTGWKANRGNGDINFQFKRSITLTPIDNHSVYVFLEINKPIDDGSFNMKTVMQKSYIINSEKLVAFMSGRLNIQPIKEHRY